MTRIARPSSPSSVVAFAAPLGYCLVTGWCVAMVGTLLVLAGAALTGRGRWRGPMSEAAVMGIALLLSGALAAATGLPTPVPGHAQIAVLAVVAIVIEGAVRRSPWSAFRVESLAGAGCTVAFAVLILEGARTGQVIWWLLAAVPVLARYIDSIALLTGGSALSTARRLLRLPHLMVARPTTAADLAPFADDLRRILGADLLCLHTDLPTGAVWVETSITGAEGSGVTAAERDAMFALGRDSERPVAVPQRALPDGWRAGVFVPLRAPDGRDSGGLLLGWTRLSGRNSASRMTSGVLAGALTSTARALGAFWANVWAAHELEAERSRLGAVIDHSDIALLALDPAGRVVIWNAAMADLTGLAARDAVGRPTRDLFSLTAEDGSAVELAGRLRGSALLTTAAKGSLLVEISVSTLTRDAAAPGLLTAVLVDKSASRQLENMRHLLLDSIHHELHGPLTTIRGYAQFIGATHGDGETAMSLEAIQDSVEMMYHVIADLVLVVGNDPTTLPPSLTEPIHAPKVLRQALRSIPSVAARTVTEPLSGLVLSGDPLRLRQCLLLVLGNAEKYAPAGKVTVRMRRHGRYGVINIADEGPGMSYDEHRRAFEPYYRSTDAAELPGSGLGLHIAQVMMDAMDGRIELAETASGGLEVSLWLPLSSEPGGEDDGVEESEGEAHRPGSAVGERRDGRA